MKESVRIFRFAVVGTLNALITVGVVALVTWLLHGKGMDYDYVAANVVGYVVAQIHNFVWCKYWIFPSDHCKNAVGKQIVLFCMAFTCAYLAQVLCLLLMVECLGVHEYLAQFLGLFVYGAANFIINKRMTFKE